MLFLRTALSLCPCDLQVHGTPVKDKWAAPQRPAGDGTAPQVLPMAPLDPALTVAQQRMNTQGAAKRRRAASKPEGAAPKPRWAALSVNDVHLGHDCPHLLASLLLQQICDAAGGHTMMCSKLSQASCICVIGLPLLTASEDTVS